MHLEEGYDNVVVVDGVPVIDKSKLDKLLQKISKDFGRKGCPIKAENITVPWNDANGKSKGYAMAVRMRVYAAVELICVAGIFSWSSRTATTLHGHWR